MKVKNKVEISEEKPFGIKTSREKKALLEKKRTQGAAHEEEVNNHLHLRYENHCQ